MIKLLALDLDGTLLYPKRKLTIMIHKNTKFLRSFVKNGGKVILVSGRNPMMQRKVEKKIGIKVPFLGCNGSFLMENGKVVVGSPIPNELGVELYLKMRKKFGILTWLLLDSTNEMHMVFHNVNKLTMFAVKMINRLSMQYKEHITYGEKEFLKALEEKTYYKLMPVFGIDKKAKERALQALLAVNDLYSDKLFVCNSNNALEISALGTNKGVALEKYCKDNGFNKDEVIVAGDSGNDIFMFNKFENSFAMANAPKYVKEEAKYVIKRVYEIEKYIRKLENS